MSSFYSPGLAWYTFKGFYNDVKALMLNFYVHLVVLEAQIC